MEKGKLIGLGNTAKIYEWGKNYDEIYFGLTKDMYLKMVDSN